ncbi:FmdE family protein [Treponema phagedenis]|uniref:FmdE family protein n=1 Tax=Treponema phagedenis TaxID=162 RepID=UPI0020916E81|nr:FmdE family protein [Treponema phagedenis]
MDKKLLWERCVQFHGHEYGGLTIGYKATLYAIDLLDLKFSSDEQVVCICENDACEVDSIQVILGCSIGKGNLLFHMTGKQAFSFYNRTNKKSVRLMCNFTRGLAKFITRFGKKRVFLRVLGCFFRVFYDKF